MVATHPPRRSAFAYDLFVVHADSDRAWVEGFLLSALGLAPERTLTRDGFVVGRPVVEEFERGVVESRLTAVVFSTAFLADEWSTFGELLASHTSVEERRPRIVPILREPCSIPLHVELRVVLDFSDEARWEAEAARLRAELEQDEPGREELVCPYRGLLPFGADGAHLFFGREEEVDELVRRLRHQRSLFVIGPSGSGKSSLVSAGVLPRLAEGHGAGWPVRFLRPGPRPLAALTAALGPTVVDDPAAAVAAALASAAPDARLLVVVDQLEETFTQASREERGRFLAVLNRLRREERGVLVATMRADFYGELMSSELWPLAPGERAEIAPLSAPALRRAIEKPAATVGAHVEDALVERLVGEAADEPGALPLIQETMVQLWERRQRRFLTLASYESLGRDGQSGLAVAVATMADATLAALSPPQHAAARSLLLRLIDLGDSHGATRRLQKRQDLRSAADDPVVFDETLDHLAQRRLLTLGGDEQDATVDLAHEILIRAWPTLRGWIDRDREELLAHGRLSEAAREWDGSGRDAGLLYRGGRLASWVERGKGGLTELERAFLDASRELERVERAAARRRVRMALGGVAAGLVVITSLVVFALSQADRAAEQRAVNGSRERAVQAAAELPGNPRRSLRLAVEAWDKSPTQAATEVLRRALLESRGERVLRGHRGGLLSVAYSPDGRRVVSGGHDGTVRIWALGGGRPVVLRGHEGTVFSAAFSPDGRRVVSGGQDGTVRVWDVAGGHRVVLRDDTGFVSSVAFSPDGRRVVSGWKDGTVRIWDDAAGEPLVLRGHTGEVLSAGFSRDGLGVVSGGNDRTVRVWDLAGGDHVVLEGHTGFVASAELDPDGRRVVSGGSDGTLRIWDLDGGAPVVRDGHGGIVGSVAFSPDGRRVVSSGDDGTVRVWSATGEESLVLRGHFGAVWSAGFSPDGRRLVTGGDDGTVRIWDLGRSETVVLSGHAGAVSGATFGPDDRQVVSAGADVRVWDVAGAGPKVLPGEAGGFLSATVSRDGRRVASAGADGAVWLWDLNGGGTQVLRDHLGYVLSAAFSPDGRRLVSGGKDGIVRVWDLDGSAPTKLRGHRGVVWSVAFSPDGRRLLSAGDDGVRIWPVAGGKPRMLRGHVGSVWSAGFSSDGLQVVSTGADGTVRVWDLAGNERVVLLGRGGPVSSVAFNPDRRLVASGGSDGTVQIRDLSGNELTVLRGHTGIVSSLAFSADGRRIVTAGADGTVRVWRCDACAALDEVVALARNRARPA